MNSSNFRRFVFCYPPRSFQANHRGSGGTGHSIRPPQSNCRSGANRGIYRNITDISTVTTTVTVPFPYGIAAGDVFVQAAVTLGYGGFDPCTAADAIDGDNDMADYYSVYYHDINLEESGKEYATFALWGFQTIVGA